MDLIIVESPTKARTLSRFLGRDYRIEPTMGHLRDLPKSKLGVDIKNDFAPTYLIVKGKEKIVQTLKKAAKKAKEVILATDPDREGEAIAWHVAQILGQKHLGRIVFHEITKSAIKKALKNPRQIDINLVDAQKARRILDRLVGYKLSPLLWQKIRRGLSAGRVQSVAVRLIVEREREIKRFKKEAFWRILAALNKNKSKPFLAELVSHSGKKYKVVKTINLFSGVYTFQKTTIDSEEKAEEILKDLTSPFVVKAMETKEALRHPLPPFTTSTLQQTAGYRFGWSGKMTMRMAQNLYEKGLITYHRTDSTQLALSAIKSIRKYIQKNFPKEYLPPKARVFLTKSKLAQEAHEAIRPTHFGKNPQLKGNEKRLYDLIWKRTIACQMNPARFERTNLLLESGDYQFESKGQRLLFDGFLKVWPIRLSENILPVIKKGEKLNLVSLGAIKNQTPPPPRYTEASLIKTLEKEGIGRPSTYAPIISLIQQRHYVEKVEGKFQPTNLGEAVNDFLVENFADIVNIPFTAQMEDSLDEVAQAKKKWLTVLNDFWPSFEKRLTQVGEKAERVKIEAEKTGEKCPYCGADLVIKIGRFGKFIACSNFPQCQYKKPYLEKLKGVRCPECGAEIVIRRTKKGKKFYGCANWPQCQWASWRKPK